MPHSILALSVFVFGFFAQFPTANADTPIGLKFLASTEYENKSVTLNAELYKPEGNGPFPAVVLMHGCGGLQASVSHAMRTHAEFLVSKGFVALILDSFGPRDNADGWVCESFERLMHARRYRTADALDALKYLRTLDFVDNDNIFQMGQSNGGSVAIRLAQLQKPAFRASAAFYPWCGTFNRIGSKAEFTSPLIVLAGTNDDWTPVGECLNLKSTRAEYKVITYSGAVHSFDLEISRQQYQGHAVGYDHKATVDSRKQMAAFFNSHFTENLKPKVSAIAINDAVYTEFLSGTEIQQLMPLGELKGINGYGNPYTISYSQDGTMSGVAGKNDEYKDTGKWWIKDQQFCRQYKSWLKGEAACFQVRVEADQMSFFDEDGDQLSSGVFEILQHRP